MSSTLVVSNAILPDQLRRTQTKVGDEKRINTKTVMLFSIVKDKHYSCRSLGYASGNESIISIDDLCKPIETYIYARNKHPFTSYAAAKHPKHNKLAVTGIREKPADFFNDTTRVSTLAPTIILSTLGFVFVRTIIP